MKSVPTLVSSLFISQLTFQNDCVGTFVFIDRAMHLFTAEWLSQCSLCSHTQHTVWVRTRVRNQKTFRTLSRTILIFYLFLYSAELIMFPEVLSKILENFRNIRRILER